MPGVLRRDGQRRPADPQRQPGDAQPTLGQDVGHVVEAGALGTEQRPGRQPHPVEPQPTDLAGPLPQLAFLVRPGGAGLVEVDQEHRERVAGTGEDDGEVRDGSVVDEHLLPVEDPVRPVPPGLGGDPAQVRTGLRFGQRVRTEPLRGEQIGEVPVALLGRTVRGQERGHQFDQTALVGDRGVPEAEALHHVQVVQRPGADTAVPLGNGDAEQVEPGHLPVQLGGEPAVRVQRGHLRQYPVGDEVRDHLPQRRCVVADG